MRVKPTSDADAEELITAADYDKVMEFLQGTPNPLKILERVALFSLKIKLGKEQHLAPTTEKTSLKKPMEESADHDPITAATPLNVCLLDPTPNKKKRIPRRPRSIVDDQFYYEEPPFKKTLAKEDDYPESSKNEKKAESPSPSNCSEDQTSVLPEEEEDEAEIDEYDQQEWHPSELMLKKPKKNKKKVSSRRRNPNPRNPNPRNPNPRNPNPGNPNPRNGALPPSREIPVFLREMVERMKGSETILVIEKPLTKSDVNSNLSRLQMPESQMNKFLTEDEVEYLKIKLGSKMNGIEALLHQKGGEYSTMMKVRRWEMLKGKSRGSIVFVLTTGWNDVVARNVLRSGDTIQVWSFRVNHQLHFALVVL